MTSITEGLPLTIYEAFASKIPVVSTDAGGIKEVLITEKTGLMADVKDTETLAKHVLRILEDKNFAEQLTNNAFELVKQHHDLGVMKENYYNFYKSL